MASIRQRSIKASIWIYVGFLIGAINMYLLTHKAWFTPEQTGLTRSLLDIGILLSAFSAMGSPTFVVKFFPYYKNILKDEENDLLFVAFSISLSGFLLVALGAFVAEPLIIKKFGTNSPLLVEYFYYIIPVGFFALIYNTLEYYSLGYDKGILTSFLRETALRIFTLATIVLKIFNLISFKVFIIVFSLQFGVIALFLAIILWRQSKLMLHFRISKATVRYRGKILSLIKLTAIVTIVNVLRQAIDGLVLAAKKDLPAVATYAVAVYLVSIMQAPYRSISAITVPELSRLWRKKNIAEIGRIYERSSINMLSFSLLVFACIMLNYTEAILYLNINEQYLGGLWVFCILSLVTIIEMGTGVNAQIIGTSTYWRFEMFTSLLLTLLIIPLSIILTERFGVLGPAIANLASFTIFNALRYGFLLKKFNMQPFSKKTVEVVLIAGLLFTAVFYLFKNTTGLLHLIGSCFVFCAAYFSLLYFRNISPDIKPVLFTIMRRLKIKRD